jgi:hypothetical protein
MDLAKGFVCQPLPAIDDGKIKATAANDATHDTLMQTTLPRLRRRRRPNPQGRLAGLKGTWAAPGESSSA